MTYEKTLTLSNGVKIPSLGFGTWCISDNDSTQAVKTAVELGYRHIDTAQSYGNERGIKHACFIVVFLPVFVT